MTTKNRNIFKLPIFPNFKGLELHDANHIETYVKNYPPYSDFNFVSLWCYDTDNDLKFSWLNNNLVIRFRDYITKDPFYSFLGNSNPVETINELFDYSAKQNLQKNLRLIPEINIQEIMQSVINTFDIVEDLDENDYIIPLKETIDLSNINDHKRQTYEKFIMDYPSYEVRELDINNTKTKEELMNLFYLWQLYKNKTDSEVNNEKLALSKLITGNYFKFFTLGIYINSQLIGFIIDERLEKPFVIGHFIKADLRYKGVYEVLNKVSAEAHYNAGYKYINIEQDLGIPGLRTSKLQRSPAFYLKKYTIQPIST